MKRILMLLICVCLVIGNTAVMAENSVKGISGEAQDAIDLLIALNVLSSDYTEDTLVEYGNVTRGDFAELTAKIFAKDIKSDNLYFHDVPKSHWVFNSVSSLAELGIVKINESKMFYPGENITMDDALRMLIRGLGYKSIDDSTQTVRAISKSVGLLDGITISGEPDMETVCVLLYNALLAPVTENFTYSDGAVTYKASEQSYLEAQFSTYFKKGVLEACDEISLTKNIVPDDMCVISGESFYVGSTDMDDMLGCNILYLYKQSKNGDKTVIWAKKVSSDDRVILYADKDNAYFDKNTYEFIYTPKDGDKEKSYTLKRSASVIYNGEFVESGIEELMENGFYSVTLIKSTGSGSFDTAVVWKNDNYIISGINKENMVIYDMITGNNVSFSSAERLDVYAPGGKEISFNDLKNGDIVSVYKSVSGKRAKLVCSDTVVSGEIMRVTERNGKKLIEVNGITYEGKEEILGKVVKAGKKITLYIDSNGFVVYAKYAAGSKNVGYLVRVTDVQGVFSGSFSAKIFDESGEMLVVKSADKITVNGEKHENAADALNALGGTDTVAQLVAYELDSEGRVKAIETAKSAPSAEPSLHLRNAEGSYPYRSAGKLGSKMYIGAETVIFGIPDDIEKEEDFTIVGALVNDTQYTSVSSYAIDENAGYEEYIVIKGWDWFSPDSSARGILVTGSGEMLNSDGGISESIIGYQGQNEVQLVCADGYSAKTTGVKKGDYISYTANGAGEITNATVLYSPSKHEARPKSADTNLSRGFVTTGYVNDVSGNIVRIGHTDGSEWESSYDFSAAVVLVYDKAENRVDVGNIEDVISYKAAQGDCSFVLLHSNWGRALVYVIYK